MTLRVTIEIVPFGDEDKKRIIRQLDIFNMGPVSSPDGWSLGGYHEYGVIDIDPENNTGGLYQETIPHRRREGAPALVAKVLHHLIQLNDPEK